MKVRFLALLVFVASFMFVACDRNDMPLVDEKSSIMGVFPLGLLTSRGSLYNLIYDDKDRLVSCEYTFTQAMYEMDYDDGKINMTINGSFMVERTGVGEIGSNGYIARFELNRINDYLCGLVASFYYDNDGRVDKVVLNGETNCQYNILYNTDGDITEIDYESINTGEVFERYSFEYRSDEVSEYLDNSAGLMFIDNLRYYQSYLLSSSGSNSYPPAEFYVRHNNFTEWVPLYYAGLLGRTSAHFPIKITDCRNGNWISSMITHNEAERPLVIEENHYFDLGYKGYHKGWERFPLKWR